MRIERAGTRGKGWYLGPWNSELPISLGYANEGIDEPHVHSTTTELYVVGRGHSTIRVGRETIELRPGDALLIEPGEPHTFLASSEDYFHVVVHCFGTAEDEKRLVPRAELGLD